MISDLPQPRSPDLPREVGYLTGAIDQTLDEIDDWARPVEVQASSHLPDTEPSVVYEARGVCLIFGPWNVPFHLLFEPMVAAIAAGNTAILKPNALTPATAQISAEIVGAAFDEREVAVFEGGVDDAETLLALPVDHIFFTGSPAVGKIVMAAAAQHLTTVTLELRAPRSSTARTTSPRRLVWSPPPGTPTVGSCTSRSTTSGSPRR